MHSNNRHPRKDNREGRQSFPPKKIEKIKLQGRRIEAIENNLKPLTRADIPVFMLYVNYAMENLSAAADLSAKDEENKARGGGTDLATMDEEAFAQTLNELKDEQWAKLADFLWAFRFSEPGRSFAAGSHNGYDFRKYARKLVVKMYELRQFFDHCDWNGNEALICDSELHGFIERVLRPEIEKAASGPRSNPVKLLEKSLLTPHEVGEAAKGIPPTGRKYEFTWRGLVFFISLALYKDQSQEFLACFKSLRLPNKRRDVMDGISADDLMAMKKKRPIVQSFVDAYTYFSYRRGRVSTVSTVIRRDEEGKALDEKLPEMLVYQRFVNLMGYLAKVPEESFEYLELGDEWSRLSDRLARELSAAAEHGMKPSPENLRSRFDLSCQIRRKERFLSLAADCCEWRELLPCLHFKRLRWTSVADKGKNQYAYDDSELSQGERDQTGLNRHYVVDGGAIRFEWRPHVDADGRVCHFGAIRVKALRGSIGEQELCRLLALAKEDAAGVNAMLDRYFAGYHRVLELMLNAEDKLALSFDNPELKAAVAEVIGVSDVRTPEHQKLIDQYFPSNISRFFVPPGKGLKSDAELRTQLLGEGVRKTAGKLQQLIDRCKEFEERADAYEKDRKAAQEAKRQGREVRRSSVRAPSKGACIVRVFDWLNLSIDDESHRFRQLPFESRHREAKFGDRAGDVGYQSAHRAIGLFETDNKEVWGGLVRSKVTGQMIELLGLVKYLPGLPRNRTRKGEEIDVAAAKRQFADVDQAIGALKNYVESKMKRKPRLDADGRPMRTKRGDLILKPYSLLDLARAATALCRQRYEGLRRELQGIVPSERLRAICRKADVRMGLPIEPGELRKSILGIADLGAWQWAYDVEADVPRVNARELADVEHVVSQIRVPNGLADRNVFANPAFKKRFVRDIRVCDSQGERKEPRVDWGTVFTQLSSRAIPLRKCYDVKPLLDYLLRPEARADPKCKRSGVWDFASSGIAGLSPEPARTWEKVKDVWRQVGYEPSAEEFESVQGHWQTKELPAMDRNAVKRAICRIRTIYSQDVLLSSFASDCWGEVKASRAFEQTRTTFKKGMCDVYEFFNAEVDFPLKKTGVTLRLSRNDIFGMAFGHVKEHAADFAALLARECPETKDRTFLFDQVVDLYVKRQHQERALRLEILKECVRFMLGHPIASTRYLEMKQKYSDDRDERGRAIGQMELSEYRMTYRGLTEEQYRMIGELRNSAIHRILLAGDETECRRNLEVLRGLLAQANVGKLESSQKSDVKKNGQFGRGPHHGGKHRGGGTDRWEASRRW